MANFSGDRLARFTVVLEAWRRGLTVTIKDKKMSRYIISSDQSLLPFHYSRMDSKNLKNIDDICKNKDVTKRLLSRANVPVPEGKRFKSDIRDEEIIKYAKWLDFPIVLKPTFGLQGKGVITGIKDEFALADSLIYVRQELNRPDVIVERQIAGEDYRVYVVGNTVVSVIRRIPANIIGTGKDTIQQLIESKNKERKKHPYLSKYLLLIDKEVLGCIERAGYQIDSIPDVGELIYLRGISNVSSGGDYLDVTGGLSETILKTAVRAVETIPSLKYCGVDILVDKSNGINETVVVLELNSRPAISSSLENLAVPSAIIDYYFPESLKNKGKNRNIYFNIESALQSLKNGVVSEVTLTPPPTDNAVSRIIEISGQVQGVGYRQWIKKKALDQKIHGYAKNLKNGNIELVVAGNDQEAVNQFIDICREGPKKARVDNVTFEEYLGPVKIGFHFQEEKEYGDRKTNSLQFYKAELRENQHKLEEIKRKHWNLRRKYKAIKSSRSWRYTELIRKTFSKLHGRK